MPVDKGKYITHLLLQLESLLNIASQELLIEDQVYLENKIAWIKTLPDNELNLYEEEIKNSIAELLQKLLDNIKPNARADKSQQLKNAKDSIIKIFSNLNLTNSTIKTGNIRFINNLIQFVTNVSPVLTDEEATLLRSSINAYLKLNYLDRKYSEICMFDKVMPMESKFIDLAVIDQTTDKSGYISIDSIFKTSHEQTCRYVLMQGNAGVGKTTLCQRIAHEWANDRVWEDKFEWVLLLPLRELNQKIDGFNITLGDGINAVLFGRSGQLVKISADNLHTLLNSHLHNKVLYILDGIDEFNIDSPFAKTIEELFSIHCQGSVLATSRFLSSSHNYLYKKFDRKLKINGFTDEAIEKYIKNFFAGENTKIKEIINWLDKNPSIRNLASVPILLGMICHLHENSKTSFNDQITISQLYSEIVTNFWQQKRNKKPTSSPSKIQKFNEEKILINKFFELLAFSGVVNNQLIFELDRLQEIGFEIFEKHYNLEGPSDFSEENISTILSSGFLIRQYDANNTQTFSFLHRSFQEYFAARYIEKAFNQEVLCNYGEYPILGSTQSFIIENRYNPRYELVWTFLAGLIKNLKNSQELFDLLLPTPSCELGGMPSLLLGMRCLQESPHLEKIPQKSIIIKNIQEIISFALSDSIDFDWQFMECLKLSFRLCQKLEIQNIILHYLDNPNWSSSKNLRYCIRKLCNSNTNIIQKLNSILDDSLLSTEVKMIALDSLNDIGMPAIDVLLMALKKYPELREKITHILTPYIFDPSQIMQFLKNNKPYLDPITFYKMLSNCASEDIIYTEKMIIELLDKHQLDPINIESSNKKLPPLFKTIKPLLETIYFLIDKNQNTISNDSLFKILSCMLDDIKNIDNNEKFNFFMIIYGFNAYLLLKDSMDKENKENILKKLLNIIFPDREIQITDKNLTENIQILLTHITSEDPSVLLYWMSTQLWISLYPNALKNIISYLPLVKRLQDVKDLFKFFCDRLHPIIIRELNSALNNSDLSVRFLASEILKEQFHVTLNTTSDTVAMLGDSDRIDDKCYIIQKLDSSFLLDPSILKLYLIALSDKSTESSGIPVSSIVLRSLGNKIKAITQIADPIVTVINELEISEKTSQDVIKLLYKIAKRSTNHKRIVINLLRELLNLPQPNQYLTAKYLWLLEDYSPTTMFHLVKHSMDDQLSEFISTYILMHQEFRDAIIEAINHQNPYTKEAAFKILNILSQKIQNSLMVDFPLQDNQFNSLLINILKDNQIVIKDKEFAIWILLAQPSFLDNIFNNEKDNFYLVDLIINIIVASNYKNAVATHLLTTLANTHEKIQEIVLHKYQGNHSIYNQLSSVGFSRKVAKFIPDTYPNILDSTSMQTLLDMFCDTRKVIFLMKLAGRMYNLPVFLKENNIFYYKNEVRSFISFDESFSQKEEVASLLKILLHKKNNLPVTNDGLLITESPSIIGNLLSHPNMLSMGIETAVNKLYDFLLAKISGYSFVEHEHFDPAPSKKPAFLPTPY